MNYYRIKDTNMIAKGYAFTYWIYRNGEWEKDTRNMVSDMIYGFDPSEPEDSPYGFGDTTIMDEIEQISYEEAMEYINKQRCIISKI